MRAKNCKISLQSTIKVTNNSSAICGRNNNNPNATTPCKRRFDDLWLSSTDLCGSAMNNIVRSPVYVQSYPPNMHCVYNISVPHGKLQKLVFQIFDLAIDPECRLEPIVHTSCWWTLYYWTHNERNYFSFLQFSLLWALNDELLSMMTLNFLAIISMSILVPANVILPPKDGCLINREVKWSGYSWAYCYSVRWKKYAPIINTLPKGVDNIIIRVVRVSRNKIWRSSAYSMQLRFWWSHLERGAI